MANAADNYQWNADNVFSNGWDLNPLAQQIGGGADGVRDTLAQSRDAYLQPLYQQYRSKVGVGNGNAAADDQSLFNDSNFQNFVKTGQTPTGSGSGSGGSVAAQWQQAANTAPQVAAAPPDPQRSALYDALIQRGMASVVPSLNDPTLRPQADAYAASAQRQKNDYLDNLAEKAGPYANLNSEARMASEQTGNAIGGFQANLLGQELAARRADTMQALQAAVGMNDKDNANALQQRLADLDAKLKEQGYAVTTNGQNNDLQSILLNNDVAMRNLGLNEWDRANYYDALKSGYLGN